MKLFTEVSPSAVTEAYNITDVRFINEQVRNKLREVSVDLQSYNSTLVALDLLREVESHSKSDRGVYKVTMESLADQFGFREGVKFTSEGIGGSIAKFGNKVWERIMQAWRAVRDWVRKLFGMTPIKPADQLEKEAEIIKKEAEAEVVVDTKGSATDVPPEDTVSDEIRMEADAEATAVAREAVKTADEKIVKSNKNTSSYDEKYAKIREMTDVGNIDQKLILSLMQDIETIMEKSNNKYLIANMSVYVFESQAAVLKKIAAKLCVAAVQWLMPEEEIGYAYRQREVEEFIATMGDKPSVDTDLTVNSMVTKLSLVGRLDDDDIPNQYLTCAERTNVPPPDTIQFGQHSRRLEKTQRWLSYGAEVNSRVTNLADERLFRTDHHRVEFITNMKNELTSIQMMQQAVTENLMARDDCIKLLNSEYNNKDIKTLTQLMFGKPIK